MHNKHWNFQTKCMHVINIVQKKRNQVIIQEHYWEKPQIFKMNSLSIVNQSPWMPLCRGYFPPFELGTCLSHLSTTAEKSIKSPFLAQNALWSKTSQFNWNWILCLISWTPETLKTHLQMLSSPHCALYPPEVDGFCVLNAPNAVKV